MKRLTQKIYYLLLAGLALFACAPEEDHVTFKGGTAPVLTVSSSEDLVLTKPQENFSSLQFQWTNPQYEFSNGANNQEVFYTLQIDTAGSNFSNPKSVNLVYTEDVMTNFSVKELNTVLSGMELTDFEPHEFEFRVKATLSAGSVPLYSNVIPITITTYLDVVFPVPNQLFITGGATPGGWMAGGDPPLATQEFTKINSYTFQIASLEMTGGGPYLFVPVYGNWDNKYGFTGDALSNNPASDFFTPNGSDLVAPAASKAYKITVNFKTGKYSFE